MSHGSKKGILGRCGESYNVDEIVDLFKGDRCPALINKPKLFFIQACRGSQKDQGRLPPQSKIGDDCIKGKYLTSTVANRGSSLQAQKQCKLFRIGRRILHAGECLAKKIKNPVRRVPTDSDILVAYSTTEGRPAYRYVDWSSGRPKGGSRFIACMIKVFHEYGDKEDVMTMMVRVNRALSRYDDESKQIPCQVSMLTQKIYFLLDYRLDYFCQVNQPEKNDESDSSLPITETSYRTVTYV